MATEINSYDQTLCTVAATLMAASFGMAGGATAEQTVLRYREILAELANGGGIQRGGMPRPTRSR
jgi:hypothetical protein